LEAPLITWTTSTANSTTPRWKCFKTLINEVNLGPHELPTATAMIYQVGFQ
jgi:hypothetical protein